MSIWFQDFTLDQLNAIGTNTLVERLGIIYTEKGEDYLKAKMPVNESTKQPAGLLHGGASVVLAESLGSSGAYLIIDPDKYDCVGLEVNANHLKSVRDGFVEGEARPVHVGRKTQVWEIRIRNEKGQLVCISRLTMAVIEKSGSKSQ